MAPTNHRPWLHIRPWCVGAAVLAALAAGWAPVPKPRPAKPDPVKEELRRLQGEWEEVSESLHGVERPSAPGRALDAYRGDRVTVRGPDGKVSARWRVALDPTRSPKHMDLVGEKGKLVRCLYELDGDALTVCNGTDPKARPKALSPGQGVWVRKLKRKKP